jgi:hypothetical protein
MFANTGMCYLLGIGGGGLYGLQRGIALTPSSKFKVQVNSVLNHCGRYGSKAGNTVGVFAVLYSLYEGLGDNVSSVFFFFRNMLQGWIHIIICFENDIFFAIEYLYSIFFPWIFFI